MVNEKVSGAIVAIFLTLCLASTPTNELYVCELFNKSAKGGEIVETGGLGALLAPRNEKNIL